MSDLQAMSYSRQEDYPSSSSPFCKTFCLNLVDSALFGLGLEWWPGFDKVDQELTGLKKKTKPVPSLEFLYSFSYTVTRLDRFFVWEGSFKTLIYIIDDCSFFSIRYIVEKRTIEYVDYLKCFEKTSLGSRFEHLLHFCCVDAWSTLVCPTGWHKFALVRQRLQWLDVSKRWWPAAEGQLSRTRGWCILVEGTRIWLVLVWCCSLKQVSVEKGVKLICVQS